MIEEEYMNGSAQNATKPSQGTSLKKKSPQRQKNSSLRNRKKSKKKQTDKKDLVLKQLCSTISKASLSNKELVYVLSQLIFSIGASLENYNASTSEKVLLRYAKTPTLGNALMAQGLHMKETWTGD